MNSKLEFLKEIETIKNIIKNSGKLSQEQKLLLLSHQIISKPTRKEQSYSHP